jgi:hypothetical protein
MLLMQTFAVPLAVPLLAAVGVVVDVAAQELDLTLASAAGQDLGEASLALLLLLEVALLAAAAVVSIATVALLLTSGATVVFAFGAPPASASVAALVPLRVIPRPANALNRDSKHFSRRSVTFMTRPYRFVECMRVAWLNLLQ